MAEDLTRVDGFISGTEQVSRQKDGGLADAVDVGLYQLNSDGYFVAVNDAMTAVTGFSRDELLGQHVSILLDERDAARLETVVHGLVDTGTDSTTLTLPVKTAESTVHTCDIRMRVLRSDDEVRGTAGVLQPANEYGQSLEEQAPRNDQELTDQVLQTSSIGIAIFSADFEVERFNDRMAEIFELSEAETRSYEAGSLDLLNPEGELLSLADRPIGRAVKTRESVVGQEIQFETVDGRTKWLSANATPILDESGSLVRVVVTVTDVTQLKTQARRLKRQRDEIDAELREIFDRIDDGFFALDEEMRFTYVNEQAAEVMRRPASDLLGEALWDAFPELAKTGIRAKYDRAMDTQEPSSFELYADSFGVWIEATIYPSSSGLSVYFRDITARKEREEALEQYKEYTDDVLDTINDVFYVLDGEGNLKRWNESVNDVVGYSDAEIDSMHVLSFFDDSDHQAVTTAIEEAFETGTTRMATDLLTKDGDLIPYEFAAWKLEDPEGKPVLAGIGRNVTEQKEFEQTLTSLHHTSRELFAAETKTEVSHVIVEAATDVLDFDGVVVYRYDDDRKLLFPDVQSVEADFMRRQFPDVSLDENSITGHTFLESTLIHYDDVRESPHMHEDAKDTLMRAGLFAPMGDHGVLVAGSREIGAFDGRARHLFKLLAANAGATYDRVERERDLEESERRYRALAENFPNGAVGLFDRDMCYTVVGGSVFAEMGLTPARLEGLPVRKVFNDDPEFAQAMVDVNTEALSGTPSSFEARYSDRTWMIDVRPITGQDGQVVSGINTAIDVTDRVERERTLEEQRKRLAALNSLNEVVRDITDAAIEQSTREEIETIVCERLADSPSYAFAWIGDVDRRTGTVQQRTEAGVEGYLDDVTISVDSDDECGNGPTGRAVRTGEVQTVQDIRDDPRYRPWREHGEEYGFRSSAAIPIAYEGALYGVLNVYAERPGAFSGEERDVIGQLGEVVGHAIAAVERKRALMSDELVELDLLISNPFADLDPSERADGPITFEQIVPLGGDEFLIYGTANEAQVEAMDTLTESLPHRETVRVIEGEGDETRFEIRSVEPPLLTMIASRGGNLESARVENGDLHLRIHLPTDVQTRNIVDTAKERYPAVTVQAQRQVTRSDSGTKRVASAFEEKLTDRQRAVVEAAYFAGYFDWPRESSGEEVGESLDISPATFSQHLRTAEQRIFESLFED